MTPRDDADIRRLVVAALADSTVAARRHAAIVGRYADGRADVALAELELDSLDLMEFCIAIELSSGVSLVPSDMQRLRALSEVSALIRARLR